MKPGHARNAATSTYQLFLRRFSFRQIINCFFFIHIERVGWGTVGSLSSFSVERFREERLDKKGGLYMCSGEDAPTSVCLNMALERE